jgi:hypothetical protein
MGHPQPGHVAATFDGVDVVFKTMRVRKGDGVASTLEFIVNAATNLECNLIAAWLLSKLGDQAPLRVRINDRDEKNRRSRTFNGCLRKSFAHHPIDRLTNRRTDQHHCGVAAPRRFDARDGKVRIPAA